MVTLKMRDNFGNIWNAQDASIQELMQTAVSNTRQSPPVIVIRFTYSFLVQLLWLSQQHFARLRHRRYLPEPSSSGPPAGMCYAYQLIRKHIRGQYLHCRVRYGRHSSIPYHGHGRPSQGPKGARAVSVHRRKERRSRHFLKTGSISRRPPIRSACVLQSMSDTELVN